MKMKYQKPMAAVEHYKLSQSIAACTIKIGYTNNACVVNDPDTPDEMRSVAAVVQTYFADTCAYNCTLSVNNDTLCFHTQLAATFTS